MNEADRIPKIRTALQTVDRVMKKNEAVNNAQPWQAKYKIELIANLVETDWFNLDLEEIRKGHEKLSKATSICIENLACLTHSMKSIENEDDLEAIAQFAIKNLNELEQLIQDGGRIKETLPVSRLLGLGKRENPFSAKQIIDNPFAKQIKKCISMRPLNAAQLVRLLTGLSDLNKGWLAGRNSEKEHVNFIQSIQDIRKEIKDNAEK